MSTTPPASGQHVSATFPPAPALPANSLAPPSAHALATPPPTPAASAPPTPTPGASVAPQPVNISQVLSSIPPHWRPFGAMLIVGGLALHYLVPIEVGREVSRRNEEDRKTHEEQRRHAAQDEDHRVLADTSSKLDNLAVAVGEIRQTNSTISTNLKTLLKDIEDVRAMKAELDNLKADRAADNGAARRMQDQIDRRLGMIDGNVRALRNKVNGVEAKVTHVLSVADDSGEPRKHEPDLPPLPSAQPPPGEEPGGKLPKRQTSEYMKKADPSKPIGSQQDPGTRGAYMGSH